MRCVNGGAAVVILSPGLLRRACSLVILDRDGPCFFNGEPGWFLFVIRLDQSGHRTELSWAGLPKEIGDGS